MDRKVRDNNARGFFATSSTLWLPVTLENSRAKSQIISKRETGNVACETVEGSSADSALVSYHQHKRLRNKQNAGDWFSRAALRVLMRHWREGRISSVRIISKHKTEKITSFRFFFEKDFYRQKGACVTSGGIFIDLSGVLRFPSALLCILNKTKSSYLKRIFLCDYLKRHIEI